MANLKIYNNGENKILFSAGDRIIQQPYDFGRAFRNINNCYLQVDDINLPANWGFVIISDMKGPFSDTTDNGLFQAIAPSLGLADNVMARRRANQSFIINVIDNSTFTIESNVEDYPIRYFFSKSDKYLSFNGVSRTLSEVAATRSKAVRAHIRIGACGGHSSNSLNASMFLSTLRGSTINRVYIVNRELSVSELLYLWNNRLFSEPQSMEGFIHDYNNQFAEIINISGTDYVCVNDSIGNKPAKIMNLPAGTLQEQLDWANANLFVPFIS